MGKREKRNVYFFCGLKICAVDERLRSSDKGPPIVGKWFWEAYRYTHWQITSFPLNELLGKSSRKGD